MFRPCSVCLAFLILQNIFWFVAYANPVDEKPIFAPTVQLSDGNKIPVIGLGTYKALAGEVEQAVKDAIDIGYRHIDTAYRYDNEKEIGRAIQAKIAEGVIKREDMFITTKLWNTFKEPHLVGKALQASLNNLNTSYVDLYLIHTPFVHKYVKKAANLTGDDILDADLFPVDADGNTLTANVDHLDTWKAMEELVESGKVRSIGVSNFNSEQLEHLIKLAKIKPVANQIECHPNLNQHKFIQFAKERNVTIIAYAPLGRGDYSADKGIALKDPKVQQIADKHHKNPGQILIRFAYQNGVVVIPKSVTKSRIQSNINIFNFELDSDDMEYLNSLDNHLRLYPFTPNKNEKYYPFLENLEF